MSEPLTRLFIVTLVAASLLAGCSGESPEKLLASAKENIDKRNYKTAIIQAKNALQKNPNLPEGRYLLGKAMLQSNDFAGAQVELAKALELKHSADLVVPDLLRARIALGQYGKVVEEASVAKVLTAGGRADVKAALAAAYAAQGKKDQAQEAVSAALADSPGHARALMVEAGLRASAGDVPGALKAIDEALLKDPSNPEAYFVKGKFLTSANQGDAAILAYRKVLTFVPDSVDAHKEIVFLLMGQGKPDDAKVQIDAMAKVAGNHPSTLLCKALFAVGARDYAAARILSQQLLKLLGDNPVVLQIAGSVEYRLGSNVQAREYLVKAVKLAPNFVPARRWLAMNELAMGSPARALAAIEPILGSIEGDAGMLALAGEIYMQLGDIKKGEAAFSKSLKLDPKDVAKQTTMALARFVGGEEDSAIQELSRTAAEDTGIDADRALVAISVRRREFDKALKLIDGIDKKTPNSAAISNMRGQIQMLKGDTVAARSSFERALAQMPQFYSAAASLAELDVADGKPESAQKRFTDFIVANPKNADAYVALAKLKAVEKAPAAEILELINKAVSAGPSDPGPRVSLISFLVTSKDYKKAVSAAQDAVAAIPDNPQLLNSLGSAQQAAGEYNQAISTFGKLATAFPGSGQPYLRIAEIQAATGDMEAAARTLRKSLEVQPDMLAAQRGLIMLDIGKGKPLDAVSMARQVQKQRPNEATGYLLEGAISASRKSWDEAAQAYRQGLKQNPASTELAIRLHASLSASGKNGDADRFAESWLKSNPKDFVFRSGLADRARDRGDFAGAAALYRTSLETAPENPVLLNNLAWVAGKLKQPDAIALAEKANKLAPDQPALMDTLAMLLAEKGETGRALELSSKAVRAAPNAAEIRFNFATLLIQSGKKAEAKSELQELAKLGDKFPRQAEVSKLSKDL